MSSVISDPASFNSLGLPQFLLDAIATLGYTQASPIQVATIPALLAGRDVVGIAQTGTGKTAAFALPILADINIAERVPQALVLCPTRELSMQVAEAFRRYASELRGLKVLTVCGGEDMRQQLRSLKDGVHVVVATPGRLLDHIQRGTAVFDQVKTVVLDEADEMLRMGFIDDVDTILAKTPKGRRVALFSATMPPRIRQIAERHLSEPEEVSISSATTTGANIEQFYWLAKGTNKLDAISRILEAEDFDGVIVFARTREGTNNLADALRERGFKVAALNGDMDQKVRVKTVEDLKRGVIDILVATDVAARGLDVERITHVINYDIPFDQEAYVHRIGRTGRAGRSGKAILFVAPRETRMLRNIERVTRQPLTAMDLPTHQELRERRAEIFKQSIRDAIAEEKPAFFNQVVSELRDSEGCSAEDIAVALAYLLKQNHPLSQNRQPEAASGQSKGWETGSASNDKKPRESREAPRQNQREARKDKGREPRLESAPRNAREPERKARPLRDHPEVPMERFRVEVGHKHGIAAREIVGAIANEAGIEGQFIGSIDIFDDFSTVDLPEGMPKAVLKHLKKTRIRGSALGMERFV
jgi:ATP-dependent RNA helicase DeaD